MKYRVTLTGVDLKQSTAFANDLEGARREAAVRLHGESTAVIEEKIYSPVETMDSSQAQKFLIEEDRKRKAGAVEGA